MPPKRKRGGLRADAGVQNQSKRQAVDLQRPQAHPGSHVSAATTAVPAHHWLGTLPSSASSATTTPPSTILPSTRLTWSQAVPATQVLDLELLEDAPEENERQVEFYATADTKIVGVRYYHGYARPGESVVCRREPGNPYDSNAIRVDNVFGAQIGHIPRTVAAKLAEYMDNNDLVVEAKLNGEKGFYDVPVRLYLHGPSDRAERARVEASLKADRLVKASELNKSRKEAEAARKLADQQAGMALSGLQPEEDSRAVMGLKSGGTTVGITPAQPDIPQLALEELYKLSEAVNFRHGSHDIVQTAMDEETLSKMPMAQQPDSLIAQLLPYQLQGLSWLTEKEKPKFPNSGSKESTQLWQRNMQGKYINLASNIMCAQAPKLISGGILADDMGLGKTLQMISLITTVGAGSTLIVAPVSVMSNWKQQIERHVKPEKMPKILIYHTGVKPESGQSFKDYFSQYDVVVTSYGKVLSEFKAAEKSKGIHQMEWRRVILDEGHVIRNPNAKVSKASCHISAQSRWVLSGTPIVNGIKDLHAILKFLGITGGLEDPLIFSSLISRPLAQNSSTALFLLQNIMRDLCLRRKKEMKFVDLKLPPKTEYVHRITFRPEEKVKYNTLLAEAKGALEAHLAHARIKQKKTKKGHSTDTHYGDGKFQGVLERLLRLRQTCNHWTLCKARHQELLNLLDGQDVVELNDKNCAILQQALALWLESQEDCPICMEPKTDVLITHCKHVFCRACISRTIQTQGKCPMCRHPLTEENMLEPAPETAGDKDFDGEVKSSKTEALVQILRATLKKPGSKVIVFSQWTSFLNIIERNLEDEKIAFVRVDGSMKPVDRDASIAALDGDPDKRVMLASLGVCSVGLNLVSANTVVLADSWWAPAIEDQAIDRVHRLGQKRETTVWRLVMEGTVEERVIDIQAEKRDLVSKAFQEKEGERKRVKETRVGDVVKLLG